MTKLHAIMDTGSDDNGRMYDPYMSSFLSPDNYMQDPTTQQGFNRYAYCMYNPLKYVDPSGEQYFGWDPCFWDKIEQEMKAYVLNAWHQHYDSSMASHYLTMFMSNFLFSRGPTTNHGDSGNHGTPGGDGYGNQNGPAWQNDGDGDPTNTTNSNTGSSNENSSENTISADYLWIKCHFWYIIGGGRTICIDVSTLNFDGISLGDPDKYGNYHINLFTIDNFFNDPFVSAALGEITLIPQGDDMYMIAVDTYDFDLHPNGDGDWFTFRNIATFLVGWRIYGVIDNYPIRPSISTIFGGSFQIEFNNYIYIPKQP